MMTRAVHSVRLGGRDVRAALRCLVVVVAACGGDAGERGSLEVERITRGDTLIVRTLAGSVWDTTATLVEEVRIGTLDGADEEMFGAVSELAPDGEGGVYVFDGRAPALRHFDAAGQYTHTLGGEGSGPGEYRDAALGLFVVQGGRVLMYDPRNARINVYDPDGTPADHWMVASGLFARNTTLVDTAGEIYIKIMLGRPERNRPWPIGLLHLDARGQFVDTIPEPRIAGEPDAAAGTFGEAKVWEMSPLGYLVIGLNNTYSFELRKPDATVVRVEKAHSPVTLHPEERAEYEALNAWTRRNRSQFMTSDVPPLPDAKPAYSSFSIGADGRIWVRVHTAARKVEVDPPSALPGVTEPPPALTWREPVLFDVFDPDGNYLGQIRMPDRTTLLAHRGAEVWATQRGEFDELYVVRYRLVVTPPDSIEPG